MKLVAQGKTVYVENDGDMRPLRDVDASYIDPLLTIVGPFGPVAKVFGFSEHTYVLYVFKDTDDQPAVQALLRQDVMPVFQNYRPGYGGRGTLQMFWDNGRARPVTSKLAAAMQYVVEDGKLYITHMSVRTKWRRNRLNSLMLSAVQEQNPGLPVVFHEPTEMGEKFMKGRGFKGFPR